MVLKEIIAKLQEIEKLGPKMSEAHIRDFENTEYIIENFVYERDSDSIYVGFKECTKKC